MYTHFIILFASIYLYIYIPFIYFQLIFSTKELEEIRAIIGKKNEGGKDKKATENNSSSSNSTSGPIAPISISKANNTASTTSTSSINASAPPIPSPSAARTPRITVRVGSNSTSGANASNSASMQASMEDSSSRVISQPAETDKAAADDEDFELGVDALLQDDDDNEDEEEEEIEGGVVENIHARSGSGDDYQNVDDNAISQGMEVEDAHSEDVSKGDIDGEDEVDEAWAKDFEDDLMNEL